MEEDGTMYAIGHILDSRQNTQGGIIFESDNIVCVDVSQYNEYWVYQMSLNPTLMYIPEKIYTNIERTIIKSIFRRKKGRLKIMKQIHYKVL